MIRLLCALLFSSQWGYKFKVRTQMKNPTLLTLLIVAAPSATDIFENIARSLLQPTRR